MTAQALLRAVLIINVKLESKNMDSMRFFQKQLYVCLISLTVAGGALARTITVDAKGGGNYKSIQAALDAAVSGKDEVRVAPGTYYESIDLKGKAIRLYSSAGANVTTIDGCANALFADDFDDGDYNGWQIVDEGNRSRPSVWSAATGELVQSSNIYTEPSSDERYLGTYALSPQSISLDLYDIALTMKSDGGGWMGVMFCYQDKSNYYRFQWNGSGLERRLVKCQNGIFTTLQSDEVSYVKGQTYDIHVIVGTQVLDVRVGKVSIVRVQDSTFRGGRIGLYCAANQGTHFDNVGVRPIVLVKTIQCVGGEGPGTIIEGFTITSSVLRNYGVYNAGSSPTITKCIFDGRWSQLVSVASSIYNENSRPTITDCTFRDVRADGGAAISNLNSSPIIANCTFAACSPGISNRTSSPRIDGCTFTQAQIGNSGSSPIITNCTFWNTAGGDLRMYNDQSSHAVVTNCIIWGAGVYDKSGSSTIVTCSDVQGGWPGVGNIDQDPLFVDPAAGDLRLAWGSPCIDLGDGAAVPAGVTTDLNGNPRVLDGDGDGTRRVDMGACEYVPHSSGTSLQMSLAPQEAATRGAAWRLAGQESWLQSGASIQNLPPGYYEVQFKPLDGWFAPDSLRLTVMRDLPVTKGVEYRPVTVLDLGDIPPGEVPHGGTLTFYVRSGPLGQAASVTMSANPMPRGQITFDPVTGLFVYRPDDEADKTPFKVTFKAASGAEQTIEITPVPDLPPEYTLVSRPAQSLPDANSPDYLFVNAVVSQTAEMLNGKSRPVRSLTIAGKTVVFAAGHPNGLYESYNSPDGGAAICDIKDLTIYAETLVIKNRLHLAQTHLAVYARRLQFTGADAQISTTPVDQSPGNVGGLAGGDIALYLESYSADPGSKPRFTLAGLGGASGRLTCTLENNRPLAWLTPYSVKMVLAHARDAYLRGYPVEAYSILADYQNLIEAYQGLPGWNGLEHAWQLEFEQMRNEIVTLLHRLTSGLDYFGNPPGWVPMLSFEVTKAFYEQEIQRAIRVLYLSYWIQNKATAIETRANALQNSRKELWSQTEALAEQYREIQNLIPKLEADANGITATIGRADSEECSGLLCELKSTEDALLERARMNVVESHKVPIWKQWVNVLVTVAKSTIAGAKEGVIGAFLGFAKGGSTALYDTMTTGAKSGPALVNQADVVTQFQSLDFAQATRDWLGQFDDIRDMDDSTKYLDQLRACAARMAGGMNSVKEAFMTTSLNNKEVEAELKKIKASDPYFNSLVDRIMELCLEKELFTHQVTAAMQKIGTLSNDITNNLLALDGMNRQDSYARRVLDPRATMYVKDMAQRALERLQKYHYYLAKSYEYRLLKPSPLDLNLQSMFTAMQTIASADGTLNAKDFDTLRTVYEEELWHLTDQIYLDYQNNVSVETTAPVRLDLSAGQIADLNAGKPVTLPLQEVGHFQYNEENIRIIDIELEVMDFHVEGKKDVRDYLDFTIEHAGVSQLQKDGQIYQFLHYQDVTQDTSPINWSERYFADGLHVPVDRSQASQSLLYSLLDKHQMAQSRDITLYARPGAWADLVLKSVPFAENSGVLVIDHVRLMITYDRTLRPGRYSTLQVLTEPAEVLPYFTVSSEDIWGRRDGAGAFCRTYSTWSSVAVEAPARFGNYVFSTWTDGRGNDVTQGNRLLSFTSLGDNVKRIATYVLVEDQ